MKAILKPIFLGVITLFSFFEASAQGFSDYALLFSQTNQGGTARIRGIGGSSIALGGDASSIYSNPAGLGFYNRSEFTFSPAVDFLNTSSKYLNNTTEDFKTNVNIGQLAVVFNKSKALIAPGKWRGGSFGISVDRIASYQNQITYEGQVNAYDFVDFALENTFYDGQDIAFGNDFAFLAFETLLVDEFEDEAENVIFLDRYNAVDAYPVRQSEVISTTGATYQTSFAYGGNYNDKIYFGASIGIQTLNYQSERILMETPPGTELLNLSLSDIRRFQGAGLNATIGVIGRPVSNLTIGLSYVTPTIYSIDDQSDISLTANFNDGTVPSESLNFAPYTLTLRTPGRVNGGLAYFFQKYGFITANVEYLNYAQNNIKGSDNPFTGENQIINNFNATWNFRTGGELRFDIFRIRAGYAYNGNPAKNMSDLTRAFHTVSIGGGIKLKDYFVDLGISKSSTIESSINPYAGAPSAFTDNNATRAILTVGLNF